jgi:hypothetical protein
LNQLKVNEEAMDQVEQGAMALPARRYAGGLNVVGSAFQCTVGSISDQSVLGFHHLFLL